jgi:asparagine synthase (glutamine-hydrolysing)
VQPEEFLSVLRKSVERRLVADVPISISLSGGTDSTSVAALTSQLTQNSIKAFTTVTGEDVGDETALISHFLDLYPRFELERSSLSERSFCEHYREIIFHMDEPFVRQSAYVRWEIAHLTGQHRRKVLLNGEGADEILGGYLPFAPRFLVDLLRKHDLLRLAREVFFTLTHPERERILAALRNGSGLFASSRSTRDDKADALRSKFGIRLEPVEERPPKYDDIKDYLFSMVHDYSLPRLLNCNDKMTMANSVEGRSPFLDHEFVDLAFSMDTSDLLVKGWRKFPLRQAMQGLVPDEILFRKSKAGFNAPIFDYLRNDSIRQRIESLFREPCTAAFFDPKAYLDEYQRFLARRGGDRAFLLHGLFLEEWARMFDVEVA